MTMLLNLVQRMKTRFKEYLVQEMALETKEKTNVKKRNELNFNYSELP